VAALLDTRSGEAAVTPATFGKITETRTGVVTDLPLLDEILDERGLQGGGAPDDRHIRGVAPQSPAADDALVSVSTLIRSATSG
jgi:hypothetical protein